MPTYERLPRFDGDYANLTDAQKAAFRAAVRRFIADLHAGTGRLHPSLRIHTVRPGVWSVSFGPDLRATFSYGSSVQTGEAHVIWRRIGSHSSYRQP